MSRLKQRLDDLEARHGAGGILIVDARELTPEQEAQAVADAENQVGQRGTVIVVKYRERKLATY